MTLREKAARIAKRMPRRFTTDAFLSKFRKRFPSTYDHLVDRYGPGGKGSGHHYSAHVALANALSRSKSARCVGWQDAPDGWGNPLIAVWRRTS